VCLAGTVPGVGLSRLGRALPERVGVHFREMDVSAGTFLFGLDNRGPPCVYPAVLLSCR